MHYGDSGWYFKTIASLVKFFKAPNPHISEKHIFLVGANLHLKCKTGTTETEKIKKWYLN